MFSDQIINNIFNQSSGLIPDTNHRFGQSSDALGLEPSFQGRSASMLSSSAALVATSNTLGSANNLGSFAETSDIKTSGAVDSDDRIDYHRFNLVNFGSVRLDLQGLQANADLRVIRDVNNNGRVDLGDELIKSQSIGTNKDSITLDGLGVGTYFAEVKSVDAASTTYDLLLDYRKGLRDFESEPNNSIASPDFVGGNLNTTRHFRGQVSQTDSVDVYKFHVDTLSYFGANLNPDAGATGTVNMSLIRDLNSNGQFDREDLLVSSSNTPDGRDVLYSDRLLPGDYFLQVNQYGGPGAATYNLDMKASTVNKAQFEVDLVRIKAIDDLEGRGRGEADFYAYMSIDGREKVFYDNDLHGDDDISPNFRLTQDVSINNRYIPFGIRVFESDGSITTDEHVDINPLKDQKDLTLTYDTLTGKVLGNELTGVYQEGDLITITGAGDSDRGMVSFRVHYSSSLS